MASSCDKRILCDHSQTHTTKHPSRHSLLLKDCLRDDLSSCSSSGFKSLPRRQCCTSVGFKDLQLQSKRRNTKLRRRPSSSSSSSSSSATISALQRASAAVISAFTSLPLSQKSAKAKNAASGLLSRSFSRKLLDSSRRFWRKAAKEEGSEGSTRRLRRSFRELLMEERDKTTSRNEDIIFTAPSSTTSSGCGSNSWRGEGEFTFSFCAASSESSADKDVVEGTEEDAPPHDKIEGVTTRDWPNEEKEQFSPVSVLDCPFEDDEEITSHFNSTTPSLTKDDINTGVQHKHTQKRRHFKSLASLEPVTLEKRIALSELENIEPHNHSAKHCSVMVPIMCPQNGNTNMLHDNIEENVHDLLNFVKMSIPSNCLIIKAESLLFDYFKQSIEENNDINHSKKLHVCKVAQDWISGQPQELYLGWEVKEGRKVYIREMDKCGEWKNSDQEMQQMALELEHEVFASLVNELVFDLTMLQVSSTIGVSFS